MAALSIVIPTRNRYGSLFPVVETLTDKIVGDDYEIVVQDNTPDNSDAVKFFGALGDPRVKYHHSPEKLSQSANTDIALGHAWGDYVLFIGDDDFVTPHVLRIVEMMRREKIECLTYPAANYYWSDLEIEKRSRWKKPGLFFVSGSASGALTIRSSREGLRHILHTGALAVVNCPKVYHAVVSRRILERLRKANGGRYVAGSCPDMNLAVSIATNISEYGFIDYPVSVGGVAPKSGSGLDANRAHRATLEEMVADGWLPREVVEGWNPLIPRVWTVPTIYAQAAYESLRRGGMTEEINYTRNYVMCYWREWWAREEINKAVGRALKEKKTTLAAIAGRYAGKLVNNVFILPLLPVANAILGKPSPRRYENVASVGQCMDILRTIPFEYKKQTEKR